VLQRLLSLLIILAKLGYGNFDKFLVHCFHLEPFRSKPVQ
jgi:hypothetical protein